MRFSLTSLAPLAALVVPGLSATINARQPETGNNTIQGRDYYAPYSPYDWKGWKPGKRNPFSCGYVDKVTYEIDCKDLCLAHDNCNSCQVYTLGEAAEQFICALFEEIVHVTTWEDDCEDDWVDDWVYYSSSY
ncbi:uncharacterized protein EV420DRAFT_1488196 [Desarmillaria tabescens]|uniref:Apple domain-containing protein n=1 Tax=Armillaria tabescens TaxID=1929756 RepID=A0AA39J3V9_ARMTA|nr:uncharacterized protein EV420DRAFT_1488196 [Desarmillaria tabescens]KAK0435119.1 hypothetical protein EV420DRAFT_1488196 [Desarmillaria tabescens]